ncbi:MAG: hypothetical protein ACR2PT_17320 [Endozoicomonas sp.]
MMGSAIAVAVTYALKAPPLVLFSSTTCGAANNGSTLGLIASIGLLHIILPGLMCCFMARLMRQKGWIRPGDMKITLT